MDNQVPTFCAQKRINPDDATLVLNGVPFCNDEECKKKKCLQQAERHVRYNPRSWDVLS